MGEVFDIHLFGQRMTFLLSLEGHDFFFQQPEEDFDAAAAYKFTVTTFGPGVCYDAPPKLMYQQFGFFKTGLEPKKFLKYAHIIQDEMEMFFAPWGQEGEQCVFTALNELFTLTSAHCLLGPEVRNLWHASYGQLYQDLDKSFIPLLFFYPNMPHPFASKCLHARTTFEGLFKQVLAKREQNPDAEYSDFLDVLVHSTYKDGSSLSLQEVTGVMMGVLLGGQHTSNVTGTWLVMHLLEPQNKVWLDRVMEEQRRIMGEDFDPSVQATYDQVAEMKVLQQCLDETLRLHPPFFQLCRRVTRDIEYKGVVIPKDRIVAISPAAAQRLSEYFPDPHRFDPSRFEVGKKHHHAWVPFGGGRHQCTGKKFAITSLKTAVSWLFRNFDMVASKPLPESDYTTMVVAPQHLKGECRVKYRRKMAKQ